MKIIESLPFEQCEKCADFILDCDKRQVLFNSCGSTELVLSVSCKNEMKCRQLEESKRRYQNDQH